MRGEAGSRGKGHPKKQQKSGNSLGEGNFNSICNFHQPSHKECFLCKFSFEINTLLLTPATRIKIWDYSWGWVRKYQTKVRATVSSVFNNL